MSNNLSRFLDTDADGVTEAARMVAIFVGVKAEADGRGKREAIRQVAADSRVGRTTVRRLFNPSERPKKISYGVGSRLRGAYIDFLRSRVALYETEILRLEKMGCPDNSAVHALLDKTRDLQTRLQDLL